MKRIHEKGSALIIIFIAVALFAALSFVVANMMRGGNNPDIATEEKAKLYASEILSYARGLRQAVQHIRISNECEAEDISFENPVVGGYVHAPVATDDCKIFNSDGGGMNYQVPVVDWLDSTQSAEDFYQEWYLATDICLPDIGTSGSGVGCSSDGLDNEDLVVFLPYLQRRVCLALNNSLGITNPGGEPPGETSHAWLVAGTKFTDTFADGERLDQDGQMAGCFEGSGANTPADNTYHFYQVLMPR